MRREWVRVLAALLILLIAAIGPILYAGWRNLGLADQAAAGGSYAEAARLYESAARQLPWRGALWEQAGLAAFRGHDPHNAIRLLQAAEKRTPLTVDGWTALGSAMWTTNESPLAIAAWQAGLAMHPGDPALLDRLIAAYDQQGDYADEKVVLMKRVAAGQEATANYRLGLLLMPTDPTGAEGQIRMAASLDPQYESAAKTLDATIAAAAAETDNAARLVVIGRGLGLVDEWGLAQRAFEQAVQTDQNHAEAWAWLGEAEQQMGQDGHRALDEALRLGPQDALVHGLRALYWKRQGDYSKALAEQVQAAQIQPDNAGLQLALGQAYAAAGDLVSALAAYEQATTLAPGDASAWAQLAAFCADNGVQVQTIGLPAALKAASLARNDAHTLDVLGWSYAQTGMFNAAEQTLVRAIQAEPDLALPHLHLAETFLRMANYVSAQQELHKTVDLDPNGPDGQLAAQLLHQYFP